MRITIAVLNDNDDEQLFDYPGQLGQQTYLANSMLYPIQTL